MGPGFFLAYLDSSAQTSFACCLNKLSKSTFPTPLQHRVSRWVRFDRPAHVRSLFISLYPLLVKSQRCNATPYYQPKGYSLITPWPRLRAVPLSLVRYNSARCHDLGLLTESSLFLPDLDHHRHNSCQTSFLAATGIATASLPMQIGSTPHVLVRAIGNPCPVTNGQR